MNYFPDRFLGSNHDYVYVCLKPHSSAVCIYQSPLADLHPGGLDMVFVSRSKPAVELPVALSVEVVGLQRANNENKPLQ